MFGPKSYETLIFEKTKTWWECLHKLHMPELRSKLSKNELKYLVFYMQEIEITVRSMQEQERTPLESMIDFQRLRRYFFRENRYRYGVKLTDEQVDDLLKIP
ncbi:hypothetical protein MHC_00975 [Mycoplasma haemocanis str. Illinois]|uniref:Uncharacterized protein n=1 Tax=Mycoplasma haemocanis (strain Illinois) TaxID=1111676 RepID=H6N5V1_MYCHN|nr:hypothetical protein [Mycoplasma haemocanis]AEW45061.1 hypothetical protein MHC_00975 [Mycoplasma haemocanis str. Illinois]